MDRTDEIVKRLDAIDAKIDRRADRIEAAILLLASKVVAPDEVTEVKAKFRSPAVRAARR